MYGHFLKFVTLLEDIHKLQIIWGTDFFQKRPEIPLKSQPPNSHTGYMIYTYIILYAHIFDTSSAYASSIGYAILRHLSAMLTAKQRRKARKAKANGRQCHRK